MNQPSAEARIAAQESLMTILHAQIKQLSMDMQANFTETKQLLKNKTDFEEFDETLKAVATKDDLTKVETRLDRIESNVSDIKATMATKYVFGPTEELFRGYEMPSMSRNLHREMAF
jgi:hypothetical protein